MKKFIIVAAVIAAIATGAKANSTVTVRTEIKTDYTFTYNGSARVVILSGRGRAFILVNGARIYLRTEISKRLCARYGVKFQ